ncbi:MAG: NADH-quinone oxidoreductase subunit H [Acidobacteriota bacterium]|nr:NADH-quinone oxidoreductase subunit H [Acidobacteriota bacterium]NLT32577.1 NADH-quinone oxidoreductase subunit H [Acidobacteriota bacterium]
MLFDVTAVLAKTLLVLGAVLGLTSLLTWMERKQSAVMQDRLGANRASILGVRAFGLVHIFSDALKMFFKEDYVPPGGDRILHTAAPCIALFFALMSFAVIPFGDTLTLAGRDIPLQVLPLNAGILFVFAMTSLGIYGTFLAGISSNNKYAFLGGLRASSQMISYEITMGATLIGLLMIFGTLDLQEINRAQGDLLWGWLPKWGVVLQPFGFLLFLIAGMAETKRVPFDLPEGESEIVGYFVEYSSMKFGAFFMTDFIETILIAALIATLFFGGWQVPFLQSDGFHLPGGAHLALGHLAVVLLQAAALGLKVFFFCWLLLLIRWTLPRFRYDQLMRFGWKFLLPASILNIFVTAFVLLLLR